MNENIEHVYQKNVLIREGICTNLNLNCYSLLQPFATIHGKYFEKPNQGAPENRILNIEQNKELVKKFKLLNKTKNIINISDTLDDTTFLSYVDSVHYSPLANEKIAERIYFIISGKLN